jgi:hypothetical protein
VQQKRRENNIDRWETVKVLMSESRTTSEGTEVGISLVVNKPVFKDGNTGFPKASMIITRNKSSYRIPFFKGSAEEPEEVLTLFTDALEMWDKDGRNEYEDFVAAHRASIDAIRQKDIDEHNSMLSDLATKSSRSNTNVGTGLSRFTKRERKNKRRNKHETP